MFLNNKRPVESFVVAKTGQAFYNTAGAGNNITDAATGNVVLADGQIGLFNVSAFGTTGFYDATPVAPTTADAQSIAFFQGTVGSADTSTNPYGAPLYNRPYEKSGDISNRSQVITYRKDYTAPTHCVWAIGGPTQPINVLDNTEYSIRIAYRGTVEDQFYNPEGGTSLIASQVTPNFTVLGTVQPADWIIQYLTWNINRNSRVLGTGAVTRRGSDPIVAMAIDTTGAGGTDASTLAAGTFLPIINATTGVRGITLTAEQAASIQAGLATAGFPATTGILTIDIATAGTVAGGVADGILLLALDRELSFQDYIPQVKTRLDVGLTAGFDYTTVYHAQVEEAFEGHGLGRVLDLQYESTQGQRKYDLQHVEDPIIKFPSDIDRTQTYTTFTIQHELSKQVDVANVVVSPYKELILIPSAEAALVTAVETALNSWLASTNNAAVKVL